MTIFEQIKTFCEACLLVIPSGTPLHNGVFMLQGTRVISLTTTDFALINEPLCCYPRNQRYDVLFGSKTQEEEGWTIDIEELLNSLF